MNVLVTLTLNGLATGLLMFLMAAGLSLSFGLMRVMNFAHGAFFAIGAYAATSVHARTGSFLLGLLTGVAVGGATGWFVERLLIRRVYQNHVGQVLVTVGIMIVLNEAIKAVWGPNIIASPVPLALAGAWEVGGVDVSRYRLFIIILALVVAGAVHLMLTRTRLGLMIRAGVESQEMVGALGIRIERVFSLVFVAGTALAALGGALIGPTLGVVGPHISLQYLMLGFIVVVIGGLGSFAGSMVAGILVGLANNYVGWLLPGAAMAVNVLLMLTILLIRPAGLFGLGGERK